MSLLRLKYHSKVRERPDFLIDASSAKTVRSPWLCDEYGTQCHDYVPMDGDKDACACTVPQ